MEKRISYDQFQSVKRVAQACNPLTVKREKLREKIEKLVTEYKDYDTQIASLEAGIKQVIGFRVEELVKKVIEPGIDVNGQPKKTTKWLPTDIVSYDEQHKQFVITIPNTEATESSSESEGSKASSPSTEDNLETSTEENTEAVEVVEETTDNTEKEEVNVVDDVPTDAPIFE